MSPRHVLAVAPDLFFAARIGAAAAALGVRLEIPAEDAALEAARRDPPDLILLDLHAPGDAIGLARAIKGDPALAAVPLVGFYSHVDQALRERALAAGVDLVLPRSAFTRRLPELLAGEGHTTR